MTAAQADFRVLGPVEAWADGVPIQLGGGARTSCILAALALDAGRVVSVGQLIEATWAEAAPAQARKQVQNRVAALRRALTGAGLPAELLRTSGPGYRLAPRSGELDLDRFAAATADAADRAAAGELEDAVAALDRALAEWRGPALHALDTPVLRQAAAALEDRRASAQEQRFRLRLCLGEAAAQIGPLRDFAAADPYRESAQGLLMTALYRAGRQSEALDAYRALRRLLGDELAVEPSPEVQRLHEAMLRGEELRLPEERVPGPVVVPAQLPRDIATFTGRAADLAVLDELAAGPESSTMIPLLSGTAGVGKTTLAVHWAHRVSGRFPDGQLYANLRGFGPGDTAAEPEDVLADFLGALGVDRQHIPAAPTARAALYRSQLAGRRVLVLLDNARDAEQVRALLPGAGASVAVVTSRDQLTALVVTEGATPVPLALLSDVEAEDLLRRRIGASRLGAEPAAVTELIERCARLPLALAIAGAQAALRPAVSLAALVAQLRHPLDALNAGDAVTDVRAVFSWSYDQLPDGAKALFRLLGLQPGADLSLAAAANLAGLPAAAASQALAQLVRLNLVEERATRRYAMHDLLRAYAASAAEDELPESDRRAALGRLFNFYLHTAEQWRAIQVANSSRSLKSDPPIAPVTPFRDRADAWSWVDAERANLVASVLYAARNGWPVYVDDMTFLIWHHLFISGHSNDCLAVSTAAVRSARASGDRTAEAGALNQLGGAMLQRGQYAEAAHYAEQALAAFRAAGYRPGEAMMLTNLVDVYCATGQTALAKRSGEAALALHEETGRPADVGSSRTALAQVCRMLGLLDEALAHAAEAVAIFTGSALIQGTMTALIARGAVLHRLGRLADARADLIDARELSMRTGRRGAALCWALIHLAAVERDSGQPEAAAAQLAESLQVARGIGDPQAQAAALTELGRLAGARARPGEGIALVREALELCAERGTARELVLARNALGELLLATGAAREAREQFGAALRGAGEIGDPAEEARAEAGFASATAPSS